MVLSTAGVGVRRRWLLAVAVGVFAVQIAPFALSSWQAAPFWGGVVPACVLAALSLLVDRMRAASPEVVVRQEGVPAPMSEGFELSAYRIVQEALTNALRHAGPTRVVSGIRRGVRRPRLATGRGTGVTTSASRS